MGRGSDTKKSVILAIIDEMELQLEQLRRYVILLAEEQDGERSEESGKSEEG